MNFIPTGILGLDEMLGGGFPESKITLLCGGPGTGKTVFSIQYLIKALHRGEICVYASLEEPIESMKKNTASFGWDLTGWEMKGLLITLDLFTRPEIGSNKNRDKESDELINLSITKLLDTIKITKAKNVVIDPLTSLVIHESRSGRKRFLISELFEELRKIRCNVIVTSETSPQEGDFYMEQFLADGVILLNKDLREYNLIKTIRVDKMRGIKYDEQPRRYSITYRGFEVFNKEPVLV
ncbi:AAA family ATPase [Candidatus Bathyarchaeota archaeon]|nr:AAA family ATPase [Candidatus Bathyarchaeota archaeon]